MTESLIRPIEIKFEGGDADDNQIDAYHLGESLKGTSRLYTSVAKFWFCGDLTKRGPAHIRLVVGPPREGSVTYAIYLLMQHGELALYPSLLFQLADLALPPLIKAVFAARTGQSREMEKALDVISQLAAQNHDLAKTVHENDFAEKSKLIALVDRLTDNNKVPLRQMAQPIGRSVRSLIHFSRTDHEAIVDEPTAEVMRAKDEMTVGDQTQFTACLLMVDTVTGACKAEIDGIEVAIRAKITDPNLQQPHNPYTMALDLKSEIKIVAKPVYTDGEITSLYISDAD